MGTKQKKGKAGNAAQYLTRTQAIRKLQLPLGQFRRLCILKGIHPREPKKKVHGANKTYYHVKDINFLMHEPLLQTFRNIKAHDRKIRKAKAKLNTELAKRLVALKPGYKVDHLVKERYPSFVDAIRDMDDPLTMVHLFATLPSEKKYGIPVKAIHMAKRLAMEFNAYVVRTNALRKVFISIKGFYYQAEILGQPVTWLVPHQLAQVLPTDVDYRVMLTFLEFYSTMLQFVNFKLYHMLGLRYPPVVDRRMAAAAEELEGIMKDLSGVKDAVEQQLQEQQQQLLALEASEAAKRQERGLPPKASGKKAGADGDSESEEEQEEEEVDSEAGQEDDDEDVAIEIDSGDDEDEEEEEEEEEVGQAEEGQDVLALLAARRDGGRGASTSAPGDSAAVDEGEAAAGGALGVDADDDASVCASLFKGLVFFLAREVPREPLLLVIRAFGGRVAWDGEGSPLTESAEEITHQIVDRPTQGHKFLSRKYVQPQWVLDSANFRVLLPCDLYAPGKVPPPHLSPFVDNEEEGYTPDFANTIKQLQEAAKMARLRASGVITHDTDEFVGEGLAEQQAVAEQEDAEAVEKIYQAELAKELKAAAGQQSDGDEEEQEGSEDEEQEEEEEEEVKPGKGKAAGKKRSTAELEAEEQEKMKDIMMTRKTRKFYERIKRSQHYKKEGIETLHKRKRALEDQQQGPQQKQGAKKPATRARKA